MSSRMLKKLHGDNDLDPGSDADDIGAEPKMILDKNRYEMFQQSLSESEVKEDDNETEHNSTAAPARNEIKKKRKKRKKKSGRNASSTHRSSEDNADIDEITQTMKQMENVLGDLTQSTASSAQNYPPATKTLLSVQTKHLNPANEMRKMFGTKVVQNEYKRRPVRGIRSRNTALVSAKENWPPVLNPGIFMNLDCSHEYDSTSQKDHPKGVQWFRYEHSASYRSLQETFLAAVESMDSEHIIRIINQQPYHVDALIQLSELCKMSEDHAMASELIEHAIFALEGAFHSLFNLTSGNCRLDYRRQENRSLYVVLFKHAQYLEGRACPRTALEISKLIMTLEPDHDPLAMILVVDHYALRAKQYSWLIQLFCKWDSTNNLSQLPNMAYSYALALFHSQQNSNVEADRALQYAVMMFPAVLHSLLDVLSIQPDSRVGHHKYVGSHAYESQPPALQQLTSLYICRSKNVWRDVEVLPWLERNVNIVLDKVDAGDPIVSEYSTKRNQRYKTPPRAILRHIILSDFKEKVPLAPFLKKESEPILMYDPLPPTDSINTYKRPILRQASSRSLTESSPLSIFFQSFLPSFNVQEGGFPVEPRIVANAANALVDNNEAGNNEVGLADNDEDGPIQPSFIDLRQSLSTVVDAMRDFLSNITPDRRLGDTAGDGGSSTDDDEPFDDYLT